MRRTSIRWTPEVVFLERADFEEFFQVLFPRTVRTAYRITGDRALAEDAATEALGRAHLHWHRVGRLAWRDGWVMKVACHEAMRLVTTRQPAVPGEQALDIEDMILLRFALVEALQRLPKRQREAIVLRYLADYSDAEVARSMEISITSAKTHLSRGLRALRLRAEGLA